MTNWQKILDYFDKYEIKYEIDKDLVVRDRMTIFMPNKIRPRTSIFQTSGGKLSMMHHIERNIRGPRYSVAQSCNAKTLFARIDPQDAESEFGKTNTYVILQAYDSPTLKQNIQHWLGNRFT